MSDLRDLWPFRHLIRVMSRHDSTKKRRQRGRQIQRQRQDQEKYIWRTPSKSYPRPLWPFRHLIRVTRRHDLTKKRQKTKTKTFKEHLQRAILETCYLSFDQSEKKTWPDQKNTKTMTKTNTFWEHLERAILEISDLSDIWSEWQGDMTCPKKDKDKYKYEQNDNKNDKHI